ncbi:MAG: M28 family peptidase [Lentisphaeria bacterium]
MDVRSPGWSKLLAGWPWFSGAGAYPIQAYSEFMPPPRVGQTPYGARDTVFADDDPYGWHVPEMEEEYEIRPGLELVAREVMDRAVRLGHGQNVWHLAGHGNANLTNNPCWPPELAARAGQLDHERYVILLPLALSRTQDDKGRVRWTLFGGSEQGPERAFWKSFFTAPGRELPAAEAQTFFCRLLTTVYGETVTTAAELTAAGFRILPALDDPQFPYWRADALPAWAEDYRLDDHAAFGNVRYLLTFRPFSQLPSQVRERYLAGRLHLLPFPGSLAFWGSPTYRHLQQTLPLAMQIPLLRLVARHAAPFSLRVPQSGWIHEPHPDVDPATVQRELILDTYHRSHRWERLHRHQDPLALNPRPDPVAKVLFSTAPDAIALYDKPLARNAQMWTRTFDLLLNGPAAGREQLQRAEAAVIGGGLFGYRFQFPAMRVGRHEVYWHRPLAAFAVPGNGGGAELLPDAPLGYLTAYDAAAPDLAHPVELWPRLDRREAYLEALRDFGRHDHYIHQTSLNLVSLLDAHVWAGGRPLPESFARAMLRIGESETFADWLASLDDRAGDAAQGRRMRQALAPVVQPAAAATPQPAAITYEATATRAFEEALWNDILLLSHGHYVNKDNADMAQDPASLARKPPHHRRDLEHLGDYLLSRHRRAIAAAGMDGRAVCGDLPFRWQTDFKFELFGGWRDNQTGRTSERDLLVVIPGNHRGEAVVMADHYDTAYMEDLYERDRGGDGARVAAAGADDNHSATSTLLQAAPVFLQLAKEGKLERDVWLLHLTGEEFPSDCMGARQFCQAMIERTLQLRLADSTRLDLSATTVTGIFVLDMIAHNREKGRDIFQISPGKSNASFGLAYQAHLANEIWNARTADWNARPDRHGCPRGRRTTDGVTIPAVALHPRLHGEVRTIDDPASSLFNTDGQIFSDVGAPVVLFMENYDISRTGYHDTHDTLENIDLDYGAAVAAIAIETVARAATRRP